MKCSQCYDRITPGQETKHDGLRGFTLCPRCESVHKEIERAHPMLDRIAKTCNLDAIDLAFVRSIIRSMDAANIAATVREVAFKASPEWGAYTVRHELAKHHKIQAERRERELAAGPDALIMAEMEDQIDYTPAGGW